MNITRIIAISAIALTLAACTGTARQCATGQTAVSLVNGELTYTPVMGPCRPVEWMGPNTGGIFAEGHMAAPEAGKEWWN